MSEPREYTAEEVRELVYAHFWSIIDYWSNLPDIDKRDAVSGCVFSVLSMLDGSTLGLPAFAIVTEPHPLDKEFHQKRGENWFPENDTSSQRGNIADVMLHEFFHKADPKRSKA